MTLLALIFLLALTLGNAFMLRKTILFVAAHDYAPVQLTQHNAVHYEWDAFVWREIAAVFVTAVLFGGLHALVSPSRRRR